MSRLKKSIAGLLGAGAILSCNEPTPNYTVVSIEELMSSKTENLIELQVRPKRENDCDCSSEIFVWNFTARYSNRVHVGRGYSSLSDVVESVTEFVAEEKSPVAGVILHTYNLTVEQRDYLAGDLGVNRIAYVVTTPPQKKYTGRGNGITAVN